jgi:DNA ligase-associated metallophosphoesterase
MSHAFTFQNQSLHALPSGALHWPLRQLLCVSDLHFGKSERLARRGGTLLPPYETQDTLARLEADIDATMARTVICLGDSFDDSAALDGMDPCDRLWLLRMMAGRDWVWITGNHDAGPLDIGGGHRAELCLDNITFRHIADLTTKAEVSGHYHPKARLAGKAWRCFMIDADRIVMPAYGTYTGGLWAHDPALTGLMAPGARAVLCGQTARVIPMPRTAPSGR